MDASIIHLIMRRKELRVRAAFHSAGATIGANAKSLVDIGVDDTMALRRLQRRAVIREAGPGMFYLDEDAWQELRAMRIRMALLLLAALGLVGLLGIYVTWAIH